MRRRTWLVVGLVVVLAAVMAGGASADQSYTDPGR